MSSKNVSIRVNQLIERYGLPGESVKSFSLLLESLAKDYAPTSVHDPRDAVDVHLADSLAGLELEEIRTAATIADIGSGAGLPALALAVALPEAQLFPVESLQRKCDFIAEIASQIGLNNVTVVCSRAEEWRAGIGLCDVVCSRAVAPLNVLCEYSAPLLKLGGTMVAWKASVEEPEQLAGDAAAKILGLERVTVLPVTPYVGSRDRVLCVYRKVDPTPSKFPRRPGMAAKKPLQ